MLIPQRIIKPCKDNLKQSFNWMYAVCEVLSRYYLSCSVSTVSSWICGLQIWAKVDEICCEKMFWPRDPRPGLHPRVLLDRARPGESLWRETQRAHSSQVRAAPSQAAKRWIRNDGTQQPKHDSAEATNNTSWWEVSANTNTMSYTSHVFHADLKLWRLSLFTEALWLLRFTRKTHLSVFSASHSTAALLSLTFPLWGWWTRMRKSVYNFDHYECETIKVFLGLASICKTFTQTTQTSACKDNSEDKYIKIHQK